VADVILREVCKEYSGGTEAVKNLNLECKDGELLCLLGPSGCGKSTTLRMIAGLEYATKGEIYIGNRLVNDLPPRDRDIAMVFETYALYPHLSVYGNIAFPLRVSGLPKKEIDRKVRDVAALLEIEDILPYGIRGLSDGQKQRVSIARALVRKPSVLLMDEPISHLDTNLRTRLRGELKRLQRELKITCIYVTHDQVEAMALADRIAVMNFGELQQIGTPEELYNHPANEFVAGFIGEPPMNFFEATVLEEGGKLKLLLSSAVVDVPREVAEALRTQETREVRVGIRPTDVLIFGEKVPDSIKVKVYFVEPRGDETEVIVMLPGGDTFRILITGSFLQQEGDNAWLKVKEGRLHIFEKTTGKALL